MLAAVVGVVLAAAVLVGGLFLPSQERAAARLYGLSRGVRLPLWLGGLVAVTVLVTVVAGAGGRHGGALTLLLVVCLVVLFGLAIGWSWARLRLMQ